MKNNSSKHLILCPPGIRKQSGVGSVGGPPSEVLCHALNKYCRNVSSLVICQGAEAKLVLHSDKN